MPRYIVKLTDEKTNTNYYLEWSTVVDAPITYGMSLEEFNDYYKEEYGNSGLEQLAARMERVEQKGTSSMLDASADEVISFNRAGDGETCITKEQIIQKFCIDRPTE
jgi:hypothetical protein